jgi:hypothetical protein
VAEPHLTVVEFFATLVRTQVQADCHRFSRILSPNLWQSVKSVAGFKEEWRTPRLIAVLPVA